MSRRSDVITAVMVEGRSKSAVARDYEVSRYWVLFIDPLSDSPKLQRW